MSRSTPSGAVEDAGSRRQGRHVRPQRRRRRRTSSDGKLLFAIDQQPYVQGYLGVTGIYLKSINGNDIGGGQPVYSGPAFITKDNADEVLQVRRRTAPADR